MLEYVGGGTVCVYDIKTGESGLSPKRMAEISESVFKAYPRDLTYHCNRSQAEAMTTVTQVRQAVQPLLQRNTDLALVGRLIVIKPVHHILLGVYIDRSLDPRSFVPTWSVIFLSEPLKDFGYRWGGRVYGAAGFWDVTHPDLPVSMCDAIEIEALRPMRSIKTIDDFVRFTSKERFPHTNLDLYEMTKFFVEVARGDLEAARSICEYMKTDRARRYYSDMQEAYDRVTQELCPLVAANDRPGLARLLHSYEALLVKNLKVEKFWERTPFPIELSQQS